VQQHTLGVIGNDIYCFIANLTNLPAVKEFCVSVKIWRHCHHSRVAHFIVTVYMQWWM